MERATDFAVGLRQYDDRQGYQHICARTAGEMPERIDGAIVLALTFMLWFCVPPLIILNLMSGP